MRLSAVVLALAAACLWNATPALAQVGSLPDAPARDVPKPRTGTGKISGRVVSADTGAPVRRASVLIVTTSGGSIGQSGTITDGEGGFEFRNLPSGSFQLIVTKSPYLDARYGGQPGELSMGKPIKLEDGQAVSGVTVALRRAGVIAGRVLDEYGDPVSNAYVQVSRRQSIQGVRRLTPAGGSSGPTNDLGQYRVYGLQPGTYYVSATARVEAGQGLERADRTGFAATYYPGTTSVTDAQGLEVAAGQEIAGVDIMLAVARLARVSGIVVSGTGRRLTNTGVSAMLYSQASGMMSGGGGASLQQDGSFTINNLSPGDYLLFVRAPIPQASGAPSGESQNEVGQTRVTVAGSDITGVVITTSLGSTLSGQVIYEGQTPRKNTDRVSVQTLAADPFDMGTGLMGGQSAQVQPDGAFVLRGLFGERLIRPYAPQGWMVKGVYLNGRDVTDAPVSFDGREQVSGMQVVLTDRLTHVSGTVTDDGGQPAEAAYVIFVPADPGKPTYASRYLRTTIARDGNPYKVDTLPPADYVAIALASTQGIDTQDPDFVERVRKAGVRVTLREGETKDVPLKVSAPPR